MERKISTSFYWNHIGLFALAKSNWPREQRFENCGMRLSQQQFSHTQSPVRSLYLCFARNSDNKSWLVFRSRFTCNPRHICRTLNANGFELLTNYGISFEDKHSSQPLKVERRCFKRLTRNVINLMGNPVTAKNFPANKDLYHALQVISGSILWATTATKKTTPANERPRQAR